MTKVDLHVHSRFSENASEWILQRLSPTDSLTDPEEVYRQARAAGMSFVTITDLNRMEGSFLLAERYPRECFTGVEVTALFPDNGCKVNLLLYGLTPVEFTEVQRRQHDIFLLRDYLRSRRIAHAVAHAIYSLNLRLTVEDLERLILLFDHFEGINGGRGRVNNLTWMRVLSRLTPEKIGALERKHRIEPFSDTPWIKGLVGGSDDRAGVFIGRTWTETSVQAATPQEFLDLQRSKQTFPAGRHNDYRSLVFSTYKVAWDREKRKSSAGRTLAHQLADALSPRGFLSQVTDRVFREQAPTLLGRLRVATLATYGGMTRDRASVLLAELAEGSELRANAPLEERLDLAYHKLSELSDEFLRNLVATLSRELSQGDPLQALRGALSSLPGILLSLPFFSALRHLYRERDLMREVIRFHGGLPPTAPAPPGTGEARTAFRADGGAKRILWFTDTLDDLNGPSQTLRTVAALAQAMGLPISIVTAEGDGGPANDGASNVIRLPAVFRGRLPYYDAYRLSVPSVLQSLERLTPLEPDECYISTPGPIGLLGLLFGRLIGARCVGIYHTDFTRQASDIGTDDPVLPLLEDYTRWFYNSMDEIAVPTREYIRILRARGHDAKKMRLFRRGVDATLFRPRPQARLVLRDRFRIPEGIRLLYAGRVSLDKGLDLLEAAWCEVAARHPLLQLVVAGDGPYLLELRRRRAADERAHFLGRLGPEDLAEVYAGVDLLVFPSTTDTFGMVVLEAQASGLPAIVSAFGGPQEIIVDGETGWIEPDRSTAAWARAIERAVLLLRDDPAGYARRRRAARSRAIDRHDWDRVLRGYVSGIGLAGGAEAADPTFGGPACEDARSARGPGEWDPVAA